MKTEREIVHEIMSTPSELHSAKIRVIREELGRCLVQGGFEHGQAAGVLLLIEKMVEAKLDERKRLDGSA